jgi:hypothetical protein
MPELALLTIRSLIYAAAFGLADRFIGGGLGWEKLTKDHGGPLGGRPIYYIAAPLLALCYALGGWHVAVLGVAWGVYRAAFGFPDDTTTGRDLKSTWLHHLIMSAFGVLAVLVYGWPFVAAVPFVIYAGVAVALAKWNGDAIKKHGDINGTVEFLRGWMFGTFLACAVSLADALSK